MNLKFIAIGSGILVVLAGVGVMFDRMSGSDVDRGRAGSSLLPAIDMAQAAAIVIESGEGKVTLRAGEKGWTVEEMDGFPASEEKIRKLLLKLSGTRIEHRVTRKQERLAELGLLTRGENGDKYEEDKTGTTLIIADKQGAPLYSLLIGKDRRMGQGMQAAGGQYVRFGEEQEAYLIPEPLFLDRKPQDWLLVRIFSYDGKKLTRRIRINRPGQKEIVISREKAEDKWKLEGAAQKETRVSELESLATRISQLELFKIADRGLSEEDLGRTEVGIVDVELFDKRSYRLEIGLKKASDDVRFIKLAVGLDGSVSDETLKKDAAEFNTRFANRAIGIYDWEADQLLPSRKTLLTDKKE